MARNTKLTHLSSIYQALDMTVFLNYKQLLYQSLALTFLASCINANAQNKFIENTHYEHFNPQSAISQHITEFFWYGCSHCKAFAPSLNQWLVNNKTISIDYKPIIWSDKTELHAKVFLLIKDNKNFASLHEKLFTLVNGFPRTDSADDQKVKLIRFLASEGISAIDSLDFFDGTGKGTGVKAQIQAIKDVQMAFKVSGVPTVIVNNEYKVLNSQLASTEDILLVADELLRKSSVPVTNVPITSAPKNQAK